MGGRCLRYLLAGFLATALLPIAGAGAQAPSWKGQLTVVPVGKFTYTSRPLRVSVTSPAPEWAGKQLAVDWRMFLTDSWQQLTVKPITSRVSPGEALTADVRVPTLAAVSIRARILDAGSSRTLATRVVPAWKLKDWLGTLTAEERKPLDATNSGVTVHVSGPSRDWRGRQIIIERITDTNTWQEVGRQAIGRTASTMGKYSFWITLPTHAYQTLRARIEGISPIGVIGIQKWEWVPRSDCLAYDVSPDIPYGKRPDWYWEPFCSRFFTEGPVRPPRNSFIASGTTLRFESGRNGKSWAEVGNTISTRLSGSIQSSAATTLSLRIEACGDQKERGCTEKYIIDGIEISPGLNVIDRSNTIRLTRRPVSARIDVLLPSGYLLFGAGHYMLDGGRPYPGFQPPPLSPR